MDREGAPATQLLQRERALRVVASRELHLHGDHAPADAKLATSSAQPAAPASSDTAASTARLRTLPWAAEAAATAAEDAATEDAEDDDDAQMFLKKSHKTMRKVRHHAQHHHDRPVRKVHHRAHATMKKHVHHKRVVDEDLDLDQPDMAEY